MNNDVIAVVAGQEITEADFDSFKQGLPAEQQAYLQNPDAVEFFKKQFVSLYLFAELGKEEKLNETEEYKGTMKNVERDLLGQLAMRNVLQAATVTDEEAESYYNEHKEQFQKPETVHAKHILMESEDEIKDVLNNIEAESISFEDAAQTHSTCPSGQRGGDLGEFGRGQMVAEFEEAAFNADLNKVIGPVKTQFGYHLIKVESHSDAAASPYADVKDSVKTTLIQNKQKEIIEAKEAELRAKYCK
ncbi:peptidylprolyl isomerase [Hespellia stercorisuis]|uniref:Peptidyl-prolyl cis-trans isomerase C n=1 Tax=Hespellia stercorisuis DSM 15480 TaxID=1121950 RepID=A0A1M6VY37_9FIRM|nr:peptidylprolyl isomerase [Hespellia stercorisuis]SHK86364.1 peptidyl-prolyl cis-trans isomerase C [Hespellia stercorisuis DSM 15480]